MKYIAKRTSQDELDQFKADFSADPNLGFKHPSFPRPAIINSLLEDQGNLCAYTMQRINAENCHIEHFKPQSVCREEDKERTKEGMPPLLEEIEWSNLFACFPAPSKITKENPKPKEPGYGAVQRKNLPIGISPLDRSCENIFKFANDGTVSAVDDNAINAIKVLNLRHESLREQREAKIKEIGLHPLSSDPMSFQEAKEFAENGWKSRLDIGFLEFCVALRDAAGEYLTSLEKQFVLSDN